MVAVDCEVLAIGHVEVRREGINGAGEEPPPVAVDQPDVAQLRQRFDQGFQALVVVRPRCDDLLVGDICEQFVGIAGGEFEGLEHLEGVLVDDAERRFQPFARVLEVAVIGDPGDAGEDQNRENDRRGQQRQQRPFRIPAGRVRQRAVLRLCRAGPEQRIHESPLIRGLRCGTVRTTRQKTQSMVWFGGMDQPFLAVRRAQRPVPRVALAAPPYCASARFRSS